MLSGSGHTSDEITALASLLFLQSLDNPQSDNRNSPRTVSDEINMEGWDLSVLRDGYVGEDGRGEGEGASAFLSSPLLPSPLLPSPALSSPLPSSLLSSPPLPLWSLPDAEAAAAAALHDFEARKRAARLAEALALDDDEAPIQVLDASDLPDELRRKPSDRFDIVEAMRVAGVRPDAEVDADAADGDDAMDAAGEARDGTDVVFKTETVRAFEELVGKADDKHDDPAAAGSKRGRQAFDVASGKQRGVAGLHDEIDLEGEPDMLLSSTVAQLDAVTVQHAADELRKATEAALRQQLERSKLKHQGTPGAADFSI